MKLVRVLNLCVRKAVVFHTHPPNINCPLSCNQLIDVSFCSGWAYAAESPCFPLADSTGGTRSSRSLPAALEQ